MTPSLEMENQSVPRSDTLLAGDIGPTKGSSIVNTAAVDPELTKTKLEESKTNETDPELDIPSPILEDPSHEEHQYLELIRKIMREGEFRPDRYVLSYASSLPIDPY
jgi:hypothetical protein